MTDDFASWLVIMAAVGLCGAFVLPTKPTKPTRRNESFSLVDLVGTHTFTASSDSTCHTSSSPDSPDWPNLTDSTNSTDTNTPNPTNTNTPDRMLADSPDSPDLPNSPDLPDSPNSPDSPDSPDCASLAETSDNILQTASTSPVGADLQVQQMQQRLFGRVQKIFTMMAETQAVPTSHCDFGDWQARTNHTKLNRLADWLRTARQTTNWSNMHVASMFQQLDDEFRADQLDIKAKTVGKNVLHFPRQSFRAKTACLPANQILDDNVGAFVKMVNHVIWQECMFNIKKLV